MKVKICGIRTLDEARAVVLAGADYLGFHSALKGGRSPLLPEEIAKIVEELPTTVEPVIVTSVVESNALTELVQQTGAKVLQLYGDLTPDAITEIKRALPHIAIWNVISVSGEASLAQAKEYERAVDALTLDSSRDAAGFRGGSGKTHDWSVSSRIVESVSKPVILAGGLNPGNIADAVRSVHPWAVDVNSGVSNEDGSKDISKVKSFIQEAKTK